MIMNHINNKYHNNNNKIINKIIKSKKIKAYNKNLNYWILKNIQKQNLDHIKNRS